MTMTMYCVGRSRARSTPSRCSTARRNECWTGRFPPLATLFLCALELLPTLVCIPSSEHPSECEVKCALSSAPIGRAPALRPPITGSIRAHLAHLCNSLSHCATVLQSRGSSRAGARSSRGGGIRAAAEDLARWAAGACRRLPPGGHVPAVH